VSVSRKCRRHFETLDLLHCLSSPNLFVLSTVMDLLWSRFGSNRVGFHRRMCVAFTRSVLFATCIPCLSSNRTCNLSTDVYERGKIRSYNCSRKREVIFNSVILKLSNQCRTMMSEKEKDHKMCKNLRKIVSIFYVNIYILFIYT